MNYATDVNEKASAGNACFRHKAFSPILCLILSLLFFSVSPSVFADRISYDAEKLKVLVEGTDDPDIVTITEVAIDQLRVSISTSGQVESQLFNIADVTVIVVGGKGGDDEILNSTGVSMTADGHAGNDKLSGGRGDDFLVGGTGDDQLLGNDGNDFLSGGEGKDIIIGGAGNDGLYGGLDNDSMEGGAGDDLLNGDDGDDIMSGSDGLDKMFGGAGADYIKGGGGKDTVDGGAGDDVIEGGDDGDILIGGLGDDTISGDVGDDVIEGGGGRDSMNGGLGNDVLAGGPGNDILAGLDGNDHLSGNDGNDGLDGGFGNDQLFGGAGDDNLVGGGGNDLLRGGSGADFLFGGGGGDSLYGEADNDRLDGDIIDPVLDGGEGENEISTDHSPVRFGIVANPANDPFSSDEDIFRAFEKAKTIANQVSLFFSFRAQDRMPDLLDAMDVVAQLGMSTIIQVGVQFLGQPNPPTDIPATFADETTRALYLDNVRSLAEKFPKTMVLSPEVNFMYWINRQEFELFATLYQEAYALVKEVSPQTDVGISFHYTLFRGCEQFAMLDALGPRDFLGITTYPIWLIDKGIIGSIEEYPPEWWSWLRWAYPNEKIIITEMGFPNSRNSTQEAQAAFVRRLPELMSGLKPESVNWTLLSNVTFYDPAALSQETLNFLLDVGVNPDILMGRLNNMGMHSHSGTPKLSWFEALKIKYDWEDVPVGPPGPLGVLTTNPADLPPICSQFDVSE